MSEWHEAKDEDIEINKDKDEVGVFVKSDDWGNVYITFTFEQIRKICEEI